MAGRVSWRVVARRAGVALLAAVAGALLLAAAALLALRTGWGGGLARDIAVPRVNHAIAGRLAVEGLRIRLRSVELTGVTLMDPEGDEVARVGRVYLAFSPAALLRRRVEVHELALDAPALRLERGRNGLNLARALAARAPAAPPPPPAASGPERGASGRRLVVELRALRVRGGQLRFRDAAGGGLPPVHLDDLTAGGRARLATAGAARPTGEVALSLAAAAGAPLRAPLSLSLSARAGETTAGGELALAWGGSRLRASADSPAPARARLRLTELRVEPALARAFAAAYPLIAPVTVSGTAALADQRLDAQLALAAAGARGRVEADLDLARARARRLLVHLADVDVAALVARGPRSRFDVTVTGEGGGRGVPNLTGQLRLAIGPGAVLEGRRFGPVELAASAERGAYTLDRLVAVLPGLRVTGKGQLSPEALALSLDAGAQDLGLAARSLGAPRALGIQGRGQLHVEVAGTPGQPSLSARADLPLVRVAGNAAEGLRLDARAEGRELPLEATVRLRARTLTAGGRRLGAVSLALDGRRAGAFALDASIASPMPMTVHAAGSARREPAVPGRQTAHPARQVVELARLSISYPRARWQLARPARLAVGAVGEGSVALTGLELRAPADGGAVQRLAAGFSSQVDDDGGRAGARGPGARVEGQLTLAALDLARLPPLLAPPARRLAGRLDADVRLRGRLPRPDVEVTAALAGGRVGPVGDLAFRLAAQHRRGRASGTLAATALGSAHELRFDLPARWPPPAAAPLHLDVTLGEVDLARALAMLAHPLAGKVTGHAALVVALRGTAGDPDVSVDARTRGLTIEREALGEVTFRLRDPRGGPLEARLDAQIAGRKTALRLESPVVLARWLRRPPGLAEVRATPFTLRASLPRLPLAAVTAGPGRKQPALSGVATVEADLRGPLDRLQGTLAVDAHGIRGPGLPATDGTLRVKLDEGAGGVDARLRVLRRQQTVVELAAHLGAPVHQLLRPGGAALGRAPVRVDARLGPVTVQRLALPAETGYGGPRVLRAQVDGRLSARGTLDAPVVSLSARVAGAQLAGKPLGQAQVQLDYQDARPKLVARIDSANGGRLALAVEGRADLSLAGVRRGLPPRQIPVTGTLEARALDLAIASGLDDTVRAVGGLLEGQGQLGGTVGTPHLAGKLAWKDGRLLLAGYGELRDIQLDLHGDRGQMVLDRLFARSGSGTANVTGKASWVAAQRGTAAAPGTEAAPQADAGRELAVEARAKLDRFRLYTEGQPLGALSLQATAEGRVASRRVALAVKLPGAHFELAEGKRKDVQPVSRPSDVIIFDRGVPRDRNEERRLRALQSAPAPAPAPDQTSAAPGGRALAAQAPAARADTGGAAAPRPAPPPPPPPLVQPRPMRVTVEAERNLWARGSDMNIELGLDPGFQVMHTNELRVFGTVKVRRGFVEVLGRRFDVTAGSSVTFTGPPAVPRLSVDASYRADRVATTVAVHVEGPADRLSFTLTSPEHPEYGDTELLSLLVTGRLPDESGGTVTPGARAASLVGGLLAAKLQRALSSRLPLDVLTLEPGQDLAGARLEAGTYIGEDLYVAYVGRMGSDPFLRENRNEVQLEYQLSARWSFEASYGDARRGSADLLWTKSY
jgi:translocation and assembly module TamB